MPITSIFLAIKALDAIHDYLLCPLFRDDDCDSEQLEKIQSKLTDIETLLLQIREGKK